LEALNRFLSNPDIDHQNLFEAHWYESARRAQSESLVRAIHETTTCQCPHADPKEVGVLQTGKPGFYAHFTLLIGDSRQPLGTANLEVISRPERAPKGGRKKNRPGSETVKDPNRESLRWERGVSAVRERLGTANVVNLMDREADSYGLLSTMVEHEDRFIVRIRHDRTARSPDDVEWGKLKAILAELPAQFEREVPLSPRRAQRAPTAAKRNPARKFRKARLSFAAGTVVVRCPAYLRGKALDDLTLNVVHVTEIDHPAEQEPVEWLLVTTESIASSEDIARVVDLYRERWTLGGHLKTGQRSTSQNRP
jgi:hypothetical protein